VVCSPARDFPFGNASPPCYQSAHNDNIGQGDESEGSWRLTATKQTTTARANNKGVSPLTLSEAKQVTGVDGGKAPKSCAHTTAPVCFGDS
jgi:hypothetical protein